MSPITLYTLDISPPCRAVYMVAKAVGVELQCEILNLLKSEQYNPEFIKVNPKHTLPTLIDDDLILTDSHAITSYLVSNYSTTDDLYPKDVKLRAKVDQMLHFDSNVMFAALFQIIKPLVLRIVKGKPLDEITEGKITNAKTAYEFLEKYLEGKDWVAIDQPTIADIHLLTTVMTLDIFVPYAGFENIENWVNKCKKLHYYNENVKGQQEIIDIFTPILRK